MKKILLFFGILFLSINALQAQKIEMVKRMGTNMFYQDGEFLSQKKALELMKGNQNAYDLMKSARSNSSISKALGFTGGLLVGFPIGTALGGGDPEWGLAAAGAVLIGISIPLNSTFNKKSKQAIEIYNSGLPSVGYNFKPEFHLNFKGNGLSIAITF